MDYILTEHMISEMFYYQDVKNSDVISYKDYVMFELLDINLDSFDNYLD